MNHWLNTTGYIAAAILAFRGCLSCVCEAGYFWKSLTLLSFAALLAVDALGWFWLSLELGNEPPMTYPRWLHAVDVVCILAATFAAAKFQNCELKDYKTTLDSDARLALGAFAVYCFGIVVYWASIWIFLTQRDPHWVDHPFWQALKTTWAIKVPLPAFAFGTMLFYSLIGIVAAAMLWTKRKIREIQGDDHASVMEKWTASCVWCYGGRIWPSLACWLPIPVAVYVTLGPTRDILVKHTHWEPWFAWILSSVCCTAALVGIGLGCWKAIPSVRRTVRKARRLVGDECEAAAQALFG